MELKRGLKYFLGAAWIVAVALAVPAVSAGDNEGSNPLAPYLSPEGRVAEMYDLAKAYPGQVEVFEYGRSLGGEALLAMKILRPDEPGKPAAFMGACIHGNEWIGNRTVMAIAGLLLGDDGDSLIEDARDELDFYIVPCINPDGYRKTWERPHADEDVADMGATLGAADEDSGWAYCRKNLNGVDLNRNWPLPGKVTIPIDWAGSPDPNSVHYRGPFPLSEPENEALDRLFAERDEIIAGFSFHSTGAVLFPAHCESRACVRRYKKKLKAFKAEQPRRKYPRIQSRIFDSFTGEMEDWLYHEYGMLVTDVELSDAKDNKKACGCDDLFWTFNPTDPGYWTDNDARAAIAGALEAGRILDGKRIPAGDR